MYIRNYPFEDVSSLELARDITKATNCKLMDAWLFVLSDDMSVFDAASIYYFAVRKFK